MENLLQLDYSIFLFINGTLSNPFFDWLMPFITESDNILIGLILTYIIYLIRAKDKKKAFGFIVLSFVVFGLSDATCYRIFKPLFGRVRPCNPVYFIDGVHSFLTSGNFLRGMKDSLSFPSNHAANALGFSVYWALFFPKRGYIFLIIGVLVAISRTYCGVHYPLDIFIGGVLGTVCALSVYFIFGIIQRKINPEKMVELK